FIFLSPFFYSREWQDSYKDSVLYVNSIQNNYDLVYVTNDLERGYIYFLFYLKTDPKYFRQNGEVVRDQFGFVDVKGFGRFHFSGDFNDLEVKGKKILYINNYKNVPTNAKILRRFNTIDGKPTFVAYEL
ncbi:MAG: hypothetical protein M1326_08415, partial [Cyanobacteria bacterium]|nr:hypothetical protein [Cyanobacteriota bacterium]